MQRSSALAHRILRQVKSRQSRKRRRPPGCRYSPTDVSIIIVAVASLGFRLIFSARVNPSVSGIWASIKTSGKAFPEAAFCFIVARVESPPSDKAGSVNHCWSMACRMRRFAALSSTTSARIPLKSTVSRISVRAVAVCKPKRAVKWSVLALPCSLSTRNLPAIMRTSLEEIVSPNPRPPYLLVMELSACAKTSKNIFCLLGGYRARGEGQKDVDEIASREGMETLFLFRANSFHAFPTCQPFWNISSPSSDGRMSAFPATLCAQRQRSPVTIQTEAVLNVLRKVRREADQSC